MRYFISALLLLALFQLASATHFRYCSIRSTPRQLPNSNPTTWNVSLTIEGAYRANYFVWDRQGGPAWVGDVITLDNVLNWGDGQSEPVKLTVTTVNVVDNWLYGFFIQSHDYPKPPNGQAVVYEPTHTACCRIIELINTPGNPDIGGGYSWRYSARVIARTSSTGQSLPTTWTQAATPITAMLPIVTCAINTNCTWYVPASWAGGPEIFWRLSDGVEMGASGTGLPVQVQPSYNANLNPRWLFGINNFTGMITFQTLSPRIVRGLYCNQQIISTERVNPALPRPYYTQSALFTTVDYLINITDRSPASPCVATPDLAPYAQLTAAEQANPLCGPPAYCLTPKYGDVIKVEPNKPMQTINLIGFDDKAINTRDRAVSVYVGGIPPGATTRTHTGTVANYVGPEWRWNGLIPDSPWPSGTYGYTFFGIFARYLQLDWTPTSAQIGKWIICLSVLDQFGGNLLCGDKGSQHCFYIDVSINPCLNGGSLKAINNGTLAGCQINFNPNECICECKDNKSYAGIRCQECAQGYYGPDCKPCPNCVDTQGICNSGITGNGVCVCRPGWTGPDCSNSSVFRCDPNAPSTLTNYVTSTNSLVNPVDATILLTQNSDPTKTTYNLEIKTKVVSLKDRSPDIVFLQDLSGQSGAGTTGFVSGGTINYMVVDASNFFNELSSVTDLPFAAAASYDANTPSTYRFFSPLTLDSTFWKNNYQKMVPTTTVSDNSNEVLNAIETILVDPNYVWRPNAAMFIIAFVNRPITAPLARIQTTMNRLIDANVVPIFATTSTATLTSLNNIVTNIFGFGASTLVSTGQQNWVSTLVPILKNLMKKPVYKAISSAWLTSVPQSPTCSVDGCTETTYTSYWGLSYPGGSQASQTVEFTIMGFGKVSVDLLVNSPPTAVGSAITGTEGSSLGYTLAASDPDNNILSVTFITIPHPSTGYLVHSGQRINAPTTVNASPGNDILRGIFYPANNDWCGNTNFTYRVSDGCADSNPALVTIRYQCVPDAPTCQNINCSLFTTQQNTPVSFDFAPYINDVDSPASSLSVSIQSLPNLGTLADVAANVNLTASRVLSSTRIMFYPLFNRNGTTSFRYSVSDGSLSSSCVVTLCVTHVNQCPTILAQPPTMYAKIGSQEGSNATVIITDPDNPDTYTVSITSTFFPATTPNIQFFGFKDEGRNFSQNGVIRTGNLLGQPITLIIEFIPGPLATGRIGEYTLNVRDREGASCGPTTVEVIVSDNSPPFIYPQPIFNTTEGVCLNDTMISIASDPDELHANNLRQFFTSLTAHGILYYNQGGSINPVPLTSNLTFVPGINGAITNSTRYFFNYCPEPLFNGLDCYTYSVKDPIGAQAIPRTDCVNVIPVNDPPTTSNVTVTISEGTCADLILIGSDPDITPIPDTPRLTLTVTSDIIRIGGNTALTGNLTGNTNEVAGINSNWTDPSTSGTFVFKYCPPPYEHSVDATTCYAQFSYVVSDPYGASSSNSYACVIVTPVNDPPKCEGPIKVDTEQDIPVDFFLKGSDPDSEDANLLVGLITNIIPSSQGNLSVAGVGITVGGLTGTDLKLTYTPDGCDDVNPLMTFYYQIQDPDGAASPICEVNIHVKCTNRPPTCPAPICFAGVEDVRTTFVIPVSDDFFGDASRNSVTISLQNNPERVFPSRGNISVTICDTVGCFDKLIDQDTFDFNFNPPMFAIPANTIAFIPPPDENSGPEWNSTCDFTHFCVRYTDNGGLSVDCCFNVTVEPVNDPPYIIPRYNVVDGVGDLTICENSFGVLTFNVSDIDSPFEDLIAKVSYISAASTNFGTKIYWCTLPEESAVNCIIPENEINSTNPWISRVSPGIFRIVYVPGPDTNAGDGEYGTIEFTAYDGTQTSTNASEPAAVIIRVRPVNSPPDIESPERITTDVGSPVTISPVYINDTDVPGSQRSNSEIKFHLTIKVVNGSGTIEFNEQAYNLALNSQPVPPCIVVEQPNCCSPSWINCTDVLDRLEFFASNVVFYPDNSTVIDENREHTVEFYVNDLGYVGGQDCAHLDVIWPLSDVDYTVIVEEVPPIIIVPNNAILTGIIAGVAGAVFLLLLLAAFLLKDILSNVPAQYFDAFANPASDIHDNPIHETSGNTGVSAIYGNGAL